MLICFIGMSSWEKKLHFHMESIATRRVPEFHANVVQQNAKDFYHLSLELNKFYRWLELVFALGKLMRIKINIYGSISCKELKITVLDCSDLVCSGMGKLGWNSGRIQTWRIFLHCHIYLMAMLRNSSDVNKFSPQVAKLGELADIYRKLAHESHAIRGMVPGKNMMA